LAFFSSVCACYGLSFQSPDSHDCPMVRLENGQCHGQQKNWQQHRFRQPYCPPCWLPDRSVAQGKLGSFTVDAALCFLLLPTPALKSVIRRVLWFAVPDVSLCGNEDLPAGAHAHAFQQQRHEKCRLPVRAEEGELV